MKPQLPIEVRFRVRFFRGDKAELGPGKIDMLEAIAQTGSISAAARQMGMSYKRAWTLIQETNGAFSSPAVSKAAGGANGGGAALTPLGEELVKQYRAMEHSSRIASASHIAAINRLLGS